MTHLFEKHENNLKSAKFLIDTHKMYAPSVHCSYYSYFQFVKCKTHKSTKKVNNYLPSNFSLGGGSHEIAFVEFLNHYKIDKKIITFLVKDFVNLKRERKKADYYDIEIGEKLAKNVFKKAQTQINLIGSIK